MNIGIDYDKTITLDRRFFNTLISLADGFGHDIRIVTNRRQNDPVPNDIHIPVIYCGDQLKRMVCEAQGFFVDVWIDDMPGMIEETRILNGDLDELRLSENSLKN